MKQNLKEWILRSVILLVGLVIAHLGVTLFYLANLGVDPFNVLVQGVYTSLTRVSAPDFLTVGRVHMMICFFIIIVLLLLDRSYIKIGTVICMICGGPIIDFFTILLKPLLPSGSPLWYKVCILALGCVILAYGMTIVIKSEAGTGPNDLVAIVISDKTHQRFSLIRIATDVAFVGVGSLLGGTFGVGTLICAFCVGPVAGFFMPVNEKNIRLLLKHLKVV